MSAGGDRPKVLWSCADAVAGKAAAPGGKPGAGVAETSEVALGR